MTATGSGTTGDGVTASLSTGSGSGSGAGSGVAASPFVGVTGSLTSCPGSAAAVSRYIVRHAAMMAARCDILPRAVRRMTATASDSGPGEGTVRL